MQIYNRSNCRITLGNNGIIRNNKGFQCNLPTNQGFRVLFCTVRLRKYSSKPFTGLDFGCTERVPSTSFSFPKIDYIGIY